MIVFDTLENPSTKAPPFNDDKYKASSSANLLAFSILLLKITALPVTSVFKILKS